jgi:tRNA pseudouridine38-40 synthase
MGLTRWKMLIEYDGRPFSGWQYQDDVQSVQKTIEEALFKFCQQEIRIHVAGRTDAGVHARGQVAHFDLDYGDRVLTGDVLTKALNAHLRPHPVSILGTQPVADDFHARFSAINKYYLYRILIRPAPPTIEQGFVWHIRWPLDIGAMQKGADFLIGQHDFTSFRDSDCQAKTPIRTLNRFEITGHGDVIECHLEARSFLHHQVRNMVGTLAKIGAGRMPPNAMKTILEAKDRTRAGMTAPSDGLFLMRVDYPE